MVKYQNIYQNVQTKKQHGGERESSGQNDHLKTSDYPQKIGQNVLSFTSEKLAEEFGVNEKTVGHGAKSGGQNVPQNTSERLSKEFKVSPKTIKRDGEIAEYLSSLVKYGSIYTCVKVSTRVDTLSHKHHCLVAPMETATEQNKWLKKALKGSISEKTGKWQL